MNRQRLARALRASLFLLLGSPFAGAWAGALPGFTAVALQKHDAGTFYVDGAIRGYGEMRMLVDTGSSYVVIGEAVLTQLQKNAGAVYSRDLQGVMADGSSRIIPLYRIAALRIGEQCWVHDVEAAVFPGHTRPILGMNILSRVAPFTFSAEPPQLSVQRCESDANREAEFTAVEEQQAERVTGLAP